MTEKIQIRARENNGIVSVKFVISHPMETGLRKHSKTGRLISSHYIKEVMVSANDRTVMEAYWGPAIARNPYLSFNYAGAVGDSITVSWLDNKGRSASLTSRVK